MIKYSAGDYMGLRAIIEELDQQPVITFQEEFNITSEPEHFNPRSFLYHGLRFQINLDILEGIFAQRQILAAKYLDKPFYYDDNCNEGTYVSLARYEDNMDFERFVMDNVCLVISPLCNAIKTTYVTYEIWCYLKAAKIPVHNRFSYSAIEYQVEDYIAWEYVRAVGIPYLKIMRDHGFKDADSLLEDVKKLLEKYDIDLPIIDMYSFETLYSLPKGRKK